MQRWCHSHRGGIVAVPAGPGRQENELPDGDGGGHSAHARVGWPGGCGSAETTVVTAETEKQRRTREERRCLFDGIADLYDATRQGYPAEIVDAVCASSGSGPGAGVLEIGCGTGQLTRELAARALNLTAIDIGAAMVDAARRNVTDPMARFQTTSFEDFPDSGPFDLIVSGTAFHWVDPSIGLAKAARLLRPGGWLALLTTGERYPEPLRTRLRGLWIDTAARPGTGPTSRAG